MQYRVIALVGLILALLSGCATSFRGSPYIAGGPVGCQRRCAAWGLEFAAMVAVGEYSEACICQPRDRRTASEQVTRTAGQAVAALQR